MIVLIRKQGTKCDKCVTNNIYINVYHFITDKMLSNVSYFSWVAAIWCTLSVGNEYDENGISTKRTVNILVYAENSKGRSAKVTVAEEIKMPHKQRQSKGDVYCVEFYTIVFWNDTE